MKLYASPASSFARKIRVLLIEKNISHELELLNLWEPNELQKLNPIGKVPTLRLDDGRVLMSSPLIADYLDSKYPSPRFIPIDADERLEVKRWEALADGTMDAVAASLYENRFHDEATRSRAWLDRQRGKIDAGLSALEGTLDKRPWCVGGSISLADIAIACHVSFIVSRVPQFFSRDKYPGLELLWKKMEARDSLKKTAPPPT